MYTVQHCKDITQIAAEDWNALCPDDNPFIQHGYLAALEQSKSINIQAGWQPWHVLLYQDEQLVGATPLYIKSNSWGEFVFDQTWAQAYQRHGGGAYYPKLVSAVPFTPVTGPRLLAKNSSVRIALAKELQNLLNNKFYSSIHAQFIAEQDKPAFKAAGFSLRRACHFRWYNRDYVGFRDFLAQLDAKRRKNIKRERKKIRDAGIKIRKFTPAELNSEQMDILYQYYARTYTIRDQNPYLTPEFFVEINKRLPKNVFYFLAIKDGDTPLGMAYMLETDNALYGRHWGSADDFDSLHFETCYYAGIEYAIKNKLEFFDAGAQGSHKIRRGFEPLATYSAHSMAKQTFHEAIADFNQREAEMIAEYHAHQREHASFNKPYTPAYQGFKATGQAHNNQTG